MSDEMIMMCIPRVAEKMREFFPNDPKSDITIIFKSRTYQLQKAHLRLWSRYFKSQISLDRKQLEIVGDFQEEFLDNVLFCFYGAAIEIQRCDVIDYFPIVKFLQVDELSYALRNDMIKHLHHYDIFQVLNLGYKHNEQKLFGHCLDDLDQSNFYAIRTHRKSLLQVEPQLFKHVIKCHNKKEKKILNFYEISDLIVEYCSVKNMSEGEIKTFKFDLIDKNKLSAIEYQRIFLKSESPRRKKPPAQFETIKPSKRISKQISIQSEIPQIDVSDELISEQFDLGDEEDEAAKRESQNKKLVEELKKVKQIYLMQLSKSEEIRTQFKSLRKNLSQKEMEQRHITKQYKSIESKLDELQKKWDDKTKKFDNLVENVKLWKSGKPLPGDQPDKMLMSLADDDGSFLPVEKKIEKIDKIDKIQKKDEKKQQKKQERKEEKKQQEWVRVTMNKKTQRPVIEEDVISASERLKFDKNPISVQTREQMKNLNKLICPDRFEIKDLSLIYRRSKQGGSFGNSMDIRDRGQLVFLVRTGNNSLIGGFVHSTIPSSAVDYIEDDDAFIFSVTHKKKFRVRESEKSQAILLNEGYLIGFSTDLMISDTCLNDESYCSWPNSYETNKDLKDRWEEWLAGESQFSILDLECYEITEGVMEMIL